jgi:hypothetical protein
LPRYHNFCTNSIARGINNPTVAHQTREKKEFMKLGQQQELLKQDAAIAGDPSAGEVQL